MSSPTSTFDACSCGGAYVNRPKRHPEYHLGGWAAYACDRCGREIWYNPDDRLWHDESGRVYSKYRDRWEKEGCSVVSRAFREFSMMAAEIADELRHTFD